jgi:GxxExxY protein
MTQIDADLGARDEQTYSLIEAAMAVHGELGRGFLEADYCETLEREFTARNIPFQREARLPILYRGSPLTVSCRADFVCYSSLLVELKAIQHLSGVEESQVINYLKASGLARALLFNFGTPRLQYKRLVFNLRKSASSADKLRTSEAPESGIGGNPKDWP